MTDLYKETKAIEQRLNNALIQKLGQREVIPEELDPFTKAVWEAKGEATIGIAFCVIVDSTITEQIEILESLEDKLNNALVDELGEWARWTNYAGVVAPPDYTDPFVNAVWLAREEINSLLFSLDTMADPVLSD